MSKPKKRLCSICGAELPKGELGFNPEPCKPFLLGTCCIKCFRDKVLPLRNTKGGISVIPAKYAEQILPKHQEADRVYRPGKLDKEPVVHIDQESSIKSR